MSHHEYGAPRAANPHNRSAVKPPAGPADALHCAVDRICHALRNGLASGIDLPRIDNRLPDLGEAMVRLWAQPFEKDIERGEPFEVFPDQEGHAMPAMTNSRQFADILGTLCEDVEQIMQSRWSGGVSPAQCLKEVATLLVSLFFLTHAVRLFVHRAW